MRAIAPCLGRRVRTATHAYAAPAIPGAARGWPRPSCAEARVGTWPRRTRQRPRCTVPATTSTEPLGARRTTSRSRRLRQLLLACGEDSRTKCVLMKRAPSTSASVPSRTAVTRCTCAWICSSGALGSVSRPHASNSARSASLRNLNSVRFRSDSDILISTKSDPRCGLRAGQAPFGGAAWSMGAEEKRLPHGQVGLAGDMRQRPRSGAFGRGASLPHRGTRDTPRLVGRVLRIAQSGTPSGTPSRATNCGRADR